MIYFLPNDRPFHASVIDSMQTTIRQVQTFYAEQMQARGHGNTTFRFETDAEGEPLVHRVDGQYPQTHYFDDTVETVLDEVEQAFDVWENVYLIVADISWIAGIGVGGSRAGGVGEDRQNGGYALVPSESILVPSERGWIVTAHELGHAFGLWHDFRDDAYIMSYGRQPHSLAMCSAKFLAVHPYFNPNAAETRQPTIELISPQSYPTDAKSIPIQLKVSDSGGLHQVILLALAHYQMKECRELEGEKEAIVTFDYDGVIPSVTSMSLSNPTIHSISVSVVDTDGNVAQRYFTLWDVAAEHSNIATFEHTAGVRSVSFSPDGSLLASGASNGTIFVWDVETGEIVETLAGQGGIISLSFSPDSTLLAWSSFGSSSRVFVWDIETGERVETLAGHTDGVRSVSFSPDGSLLAAGTGDGTIFVWDVEAGEIVETLVGHTDWVESVAFAPDGSLLASASSDRTVKLWDLSKRTQSRPQTIVKISGDDQQGSINEPLANPLIVEVRDQHGAPLQDVQVTFTVTRGDGTLTIDNTTTDANGQAQSMLTLGPNPGNNIVLVSATGLVAETFNALGRPPIATLINDALTDFSLFADAFGSSDLRFDLDANGTVDFADFFLFVDAYDESEREQLLALAQELIGLPEGGQLYQNAPNPFNSQTVLSYFLLTPGPMRLEVFTLTGQRVAVLSTGPQQAGRHRLAWDGRDSEGRPLASGVYLYRLVSAEGVLTRKLILLR